MNGVEARFSVQDFVSKAVRQDPEQTTEECTITDFPNTNVLLQSVSSLPGVHTSKNCSVYK